MICIKLSVYFICFGNICLCFFFISFDATLLAPSQSINNSLMTKQFDLFLINPSNNTPNSKTKKKWEFYLFAQWLKRIYYKKTSRKNLFFIVNTLADESVVCSKSRCNMMNAFQIQCFSFYYPSYFDPKKKYFC